MHHLPAAIQLSQVVYAPILRYAMRTSITKFVVVVSLLSMQIKCIIKCAKFAKVVNILPLAVCQLLSGNKAQVPSALQILPINRHR